MQELKESSPPQENLRSSNLGVFDNSGGVLSSRGDWEQVTPLLLLFFGGFRSLFLICIWSIVCSVPLVFLCFDLSLLLGDCSTESIGFPTLFLSLRIFCSVCFLLSAFVSTFYLYSVVFWLFVRFLLVLLVALVFISSLCSFFSLLSFCLGFVVVIICLSFIFVLLTCF